MARKIQTYPPKKQVICLISALSMALTESDEVKKTWAGDAYDRAAGFGRVHELRTEDFTLIKKLTIEQVVEASQD